MFLISTLALALTLLAICTHYALSQEGKCEESCIKSVAKCKNETSDECKNEFHYFVKCTSTCNSSDFKEFKINLKPSGGDDLDLGFPFEFMKNLDKKFKNYVELMKEGVLKSQEHHEDSTKIEEYIDKPSLGTLEKEDSFYKKFLQSTKDSIDKHDFLDSVHTLFNPVVLPAKMSNFFYTHFLKKRSTGRVSLMPFPYDMAQEYVLSKRQWQPQNMCNHKKGRFSVNC